MILFESQAGAIPLPARLSRSPLTEARLPTIKAGAPSSKQGDPASHAESATDA